MISRPLLLIPALTLVACHAGPATQNNPDGGAPESPATPGGGTTVEKKPHVPLNAEGTRVYLAQIAPYLVGRELNATELSAINAQAEAAVPSVLKGWSEEPGFIEGARMLMQKKLSLSGSRGGVDFELPGNLAAYIVKNKLPLKTLLTADYCVSGAGEKIECDTGAPFKAGVVVTRAYMMGRASRFNLTRASTLLNVFACRHYPMEQELQPPLDRTTLLPMFQAQTPQEQTEPLAANAFGNGFACYSCHGQFSAHAQLFVKFDNTGIWRTEATGKQDPAGELGRSVNGLYTSHLNDPTAASKENTQIFGKSVANLAEGAKAIADSPTFVECQSRNLLEYALGIDSSAPISKEVLAKIGATATAANAEPTFGDLVISTFTNVDVIDAVTASIGVRQ